MGIRGRDREIDPTGGHRGRGRDREIDPTEE